MTRWTISLTKVSLVVLCMFVNQSTGDNDNNHMLSKKVYCIEKNGLETSEN